MKNPPIRWALLTAAMLALTACGTGGGDSSEVTLTYRLWDDQQKAGYEKVMASFEKANPGVKVKIELLPYDQYWTKLTADAVAGTAPDVFWMTPTQFPEFVTKGVLAPVQIDAAKYHPTVVGSFAYQGKQYGVPKDWGVVGLLYNKDLFKKAGVEMPDKLTWAADGTGTLLDTARKLTVDEAGKHPGDAGFDPAKVTTYGFASWNHYQTQWMNWVASNGGKIVDQPFGKYAFNDPAAVQGLRFGVDLVNKHQVSPPATQTNPPTGKVTDMFKAGQIAMFPANNALLPFVAPESTFEVGVALMPEGPKGRSVNLNGLAEVVYAKSKHPEQAMKLAAYLGTEEPQKMMADGGYVFPALNGLTQGYVDYWKAKNLDVSPFVKEAEGTTFPLPVTTGFTGFETKLNQLFNEMYLGKLSPQEAADQAVAAGNSSQ